MSTGYKIFTVDINAGYTLYLFKTLPRLSPRLDEFFLSRT